MQKINLIITASGSSQRFGEENKLFYPLNSSCVLIESIKPFLQFSSISKIIIALEKSTIQTFDSLLDTFNVCDSRIVTTVGGHSRTQTVKNAIELLSQDCEYVLIHDGARPYVTNTLIENVIKGAIPTGASVALVKLTDALVCIDGYVHPQNRELFRGVQTPACFEKFRLKTAYNQADKDFFDDISVVQTYQKGEVTQIDGDKTNIKITTLKDIDNQLVGCGYDIHELVEGKGIPLLGKFIECPFSFVAHSDGDVPIHAIMDSILSALGLRDIGYYFPVDDAKYDDIDSKILLREVLKKMRDKGYKLDNIAVTIIAQSPMISPHISDMQKIMSHILEIPTTKIGISATTNEKIGDIGAGSAIASYTTVLLKRI